MLLLGVLVIGIVVVLSLKCWWISLRDEGVGLLNLLAQRAFLFLALARRRRTVATSSTRPAGAPSWIAGGFLVCFFALVILGEGDGVVLWVVENATKSLVWVVVKGVVVWLLSDVVCLRSSAVVLERVQLYFDAAGGSAFILSREGWIV